MPPLQSAKVTIENDVPKRNNFELAADFLCLFAPKRQNINAVGIHRVSTTKTDMQNELKSLKNVNVDIRFYKRSEWAQLTPDQRKKCILTRKLQLDGSERGTKRKSFSSDKEKQYKKRIQDQGLIIAALKAGKNKDEDSGSSSTNGNDDSNKSVNFNEHLIQGKSTTM